MFKVLERMARLPFANRIEEPLVYNGVHPFRAAMPLHLTVNAVAVVGHKMTAHRRSRIYHTPSAAVPSGSRHLVQHHFWECGVLQSTAELTQASLWLAITPGAMATWVWDVTAAVSICVPWGRQVLAGAAPRRCLASWYASWVSPLEAFTRTALTPVLPFSVPLALRTGRRHSSRI